MITGARNCSRRRRREIVITSAWLVPALFRGFLLRGKAMMMTTPLSPRGGGSNTGGKVPLACVRACVRACMSAELPQLRVDRSNGPQLSVKMIEFPVEIGCRLTVNDTGDPGERPSNEEVRHQKPLRAPTFYEPPRSDNFTNSVRSRDRNLNISSGSSARAGEV